MPKHARIRNILLFDTFVAIDEEPYEIAHDDADEFLFDVGGEADIFSCKALFATDVEIKCMYEDFFDPDDGKCRPIWFYKADYLPSSAGGPKGCECAFEERIMSCNGGNLCLKKDSEGYEKKLAAEIDRRWMLIENGVKGEGEGNANNLVNDFLNIEKSQYDVYFPSDNKYDLQGFSLYPAYYDHVQMQLDSESYFTKDRVADLLADDSKFKFHCDLRIQYQGVENFEDKNTERYHNIIFIKTHLLNGFTHILGLILNPNKVGIERYIAFTRFGEVMLEGFYCKHYSTPPPYSLRNR